ncbi:NAD(P)-dependent oxidoreductase [Coxiella burnetii]|uniref:NAD(P)-dependent oxidoreductase n=1 Tax=Coxiella burnetii TaxID=777 RepID=UPI000BFC4C19|nr:NAD(P)-dependent oxidoreductase [Coxiella burnetii]PHH57237.1 hydroxyacid dehydrogenase [Coxiella burnetii]
MAHVEDKDVDEILILDHGGYALSFIPEQILRKYKVIGVEKTTAGLINLDAQGLPPFPLLGVANCAAKKILESPLIAEAIVKKLLPLIPIKENNLTCGVIGYGSIGKAITDKLLSMDHKVIVYDNEPNQLRSVNKMKNLATTNELPALVASSDYIFGCTGRDVATSIDSFRLSPKNKTLISCSSEDKEFLSLLQLVQQKNNGKVAAKPLADVEYKTDMGATIRILRGGFPINFDDSGESVPANDIQLTRALVLGSVLQAIQFFGKSEILDKGGVYALDPQIQSFVIREWLKYQPAHRFPKDITDKFQNEEWILEHSGGTYESCEVFSENYTDRDTHTFLLK